jgi:hypothetical protein
MNKFSKKYGNSFCRPRPIQKKKEPAPPPPSIQGLFNWKKFPIQRKQNGQTSFQISQLPEGGKGQPMPPNIQENMEAAFGEDFSDVRIHVGQQAQAVGAIAYTQGTDIYFSQGTYSPYTLNGKKLLAHELAHVVQQKQGRVRNPFTKGAAIVDDPALEAEADRMMSKATGTNQITPLPKVAKTVQKNLPANYQKIIQRVKAYRVESPRSYKIQFSEEGYVVGFKGIEDAYGINISFVYQEHSEYFARERENVEGLRVVEFEMNDDFWLAVEHKMGTAPKKEKPSPKWEKKMEKLKTPSWSDGKDLPNHIKQTALAFSNEWLDVLKEAIEKRSPAQISYPLEEQEVEDNDVVWGFPKKEDPKEEMEMLYKEGMEMPYKEAMKVFGDYLPLAKAKRFGLI